MGEIRIVSPGKKRRYPYPVCKNISIFHGCVVWIEKSVTRVTDRHHEACRMIPNRDPECTHDRYFFLHTF